MKKWQIVKAVLYLLLSLFIFIFNLEIVPYVGILVGAIVCMYAIEELIVAAVKKTIFYNFYILSDGIVQLLVSAILFLISLDFLKVCIVWGVWSILRESKEFAEAVNNIAHRRLGIINAIESVVVIVLSFLLILETNEEHARLHVFLLAIELAIVVLFYFIEIVRNKIVKKKGIAAEKLPDENSNELTI